MKTDLSGKNIKELFDIETKCKNINNVLKSLIVNFGDGDIIFNNDNFGTARKYPCFIESKKSLNFHPTLIIFKDIATARKRGDRWIDKHNQIFWL